MGYPINEQIGENYRREDEDPDAPEGFCNIYLEGNCFDLLQDNVESDHETDNDNESEKPRIICKIPENNWMPSHFLFPMK